MNLSRRELADELAATWIDADEAHRVSADIFVPCGLGGVLTPRVIDELRVLAVCGAIVSGELIVGGAAALAGRGIVWVPDFVANAGGVIYLAGASAPDADLTAVAQRVDAIGETVAAILTHASDTGITTLAAAERLSAARLDAVG